MKYILLGIIVWFVSLAVMRFTIEQYLERVMPENALEQTIDAVEWRSGIRETVELKGVSE